MTDLKTYAIDTIMCALSIEFPNADGRELRERALSFVAIAEQYDVPLGELQLWVHVRAPEKEWSLSEWRRYCERYVDFRAKYAGEKAAS